MPPPRIAPTFSENRMSLFSKSHLPFLEMAGAILAGATDSHARHRLSKQNLLKEAKVSFVANDAFTPRRQFITSLTSSCVKQRSKVLSCTPPEGRSPMVT